MPVHRRLGYEEPIEKLKLGYVMAILRLFGKARDIKQREGWLALGRRLVEYLKFERHCVYITEYDLQEMRNPPMETKLQDQDRLNIHFVMSLDQLEKLISSGFDLSSYSQGIRTLEKRILHGAVAILCFMGHELVHWVFSATSEQAQKVVDPYPVKVDYADKEVYVGSAETVKKLRGMGLFPYVTYKRRELLKEQGFRKTVSTIGASNIPSLRYHAKMEGVVTGKGNYSRILWWKFWKQTSFTRPIPRNEFIHSLNLK